MTDRDTGGGYRTFVDWVRNPWTAVAFAVYCTTMAVAMLAGHVSVPHIPKNVSAATMLTFGLGWTAVAYRERSIEVTD